MLTCMTAARWRAGGRRSPGFASPSAITQRTCAATIITGDERDIDVLVGLTRRTNIAVDVLGRPEDAVTALGISSQGLARGLRELLDDVEQFSPTVAALAADLFAVADW